MFAAAAAATAAAAAATAAAAAAACVCVCGIDYTGQYTKLKRDRPIFHG
jgi:hypothetical protein